MNVEVYKNNRIKDIKFYLRGINYKNLDSEILVEKLSSEIEVFFNQNSLYRKETYKFILTVRNLYDSLLMEELEFADTKDAVDTAIEIFEKKLKILIKEFKNAILKKHYEDTGYQSYTINNSIESIVIKIRNIDEQKRSAEEIHNLMELYGLKDIFVVVHTLICMIKDKAIKSKTLNDLISLKYTFGTPVYKEKMSKYMTMVMNEKDYNKFLDKYNILLDEMNVTQDDIKWLEEQEAPKTK